MNKQKETAIKDLLQALDITWEQYLTIKKDADRIKCSFHASYLSYQATNDPFNVNII